MNRKIVFVLMLVLLIVVAAIAQAQGSSGQPYGGPGLLQTTFYADKNIDVGTVSMWNSHEKFKLHIKTTDGWLVRKTEIYVGYPDVDPLPITSSGNPIPGHFPFRRTYREPQPNHTLVVDLKDELGFSWGSNYREFSAPTIAVHAEVVKLSNKGKTIAKKAAWAFGPNEFPVKNSRAWGWYFDYQLAHPMRGHFIDSPVVGLGYRGPTQEGVTSTDDGDGGFLFFPDEQVEFHVGNLVLGQATAAKKVSPLDLFPGGGTDELVNNPVINVARLLQTLDVDRTDGRIDITGTEVCVNLAMRELGIEAVDFGVDADVDSLLLATVAHCAALVPTPITISVVSAEEAQADLESGLNASGIFRKNISKTEDFNKSKQKLEVMPVYLPPLRSNGDPSYCDDNENGVYDVDIDRLGVPYEEWRLNGDPEGLECDPRVDGDACTVTILECRNIAKPLVVTYREGVDIYDTTKVNEDFWSGRFSTDIVTAISRDDGTTWKRMNVSRMGDLSSFDLETGEPFPGTSSSPYLKIDDNYILNVWESKYCKSGTPRYAIQTCDDPDTPEVETPETGCAIYCSGNPDNNTETCEPDYPYDDDYFVTDIWGVRGQQQSVDYDEVDDVAELGVGEIPYSCLWAARGVIVTEKEIVNDTFDSLEMEDDPLTTDIDETVIIAQGDIVWFKPERLTSGRRDAYIPAVGSARGAGFAIAWQEDPSGLRPGKGKGPGEGWSGAISNNKTDIWYSYISSDDFAVIDENFVPSGPGNDPNGGGSGEDNTGLGRPKALVPFSLPVRVSDNDMVNVDTLKVQISDECETIGDDPDSSIAPVCFPKTEPLDEENNTFIPLDPLVIENLFCDGPNPVDNCCDHDNHHDDPNCEGLEGLHGNLTGTKRFAYMARNIDEYDNELMTYDPDGDGIPDYQYYPDRGGALDLCDTSGDNSSSFMDELPGTTNRERWYAFANVQDASKLVCVTEDGRLLDGDTSASRPNIQLQPYVNKNGTPSDTSDDFKSAWVLLGYEESKGMGHSLDASEHDNPVDEIIGDSEDDSGQLKPIKQDLGKNVIYHSFDFTQPDLVSAGHIVNLPALCGGLYPTYCDDPKTTDEIETGNGNPTCTCEPGQPIPLHFDYLIDHDDNPDTPDEWMPDETQFMQYRTEIARRARFIVQSPGKVGDTNTLGAIIFKQGQEGQGRPADVFIRRFVKSGSGNPYSFDNMECSTSLDDSTPEFTTLEECPNGAGDKDSATGYNCNVWGESSGDKLCGGVFTATDSAGTSLDYNRRDHINLTSHDIQLAVDAGPDDETPDDPTDDRYGTNKVLLWMQNDYNLGDESYGFVDTEVAIVDGVPEQDLACDVLGLADGVSDVCPAMYSNARSHRGFIRGDFMVTAYAWSPNWAAGRNGNDRYNFYIRKSFDGGQTWTTTPAGKGGEGVTYCQEWRSDPTNPDDDGKGNAPPVYDGFDPECITLCPPCPDGETCDCVPTGDPIAAGAFEPARNMSEINNNKETSSDPRVGATPPTYPVDGRLANQPNLCPNKICKFPEDTYQNHIFFVAWGTGNNQKYTGTNDIGGEASPLDLYYTRSVDYGDNFLKVPWEVNGENSLFTGDTVWRYERLAWGEEEQGECQLKATSDGSKVYAIYHQLTPVEDLDEVVTRWYPWEVEYSHDNDLWFRRLIFWPENLDGVANEAVVQTFPLKDAASSRNESFLPWAPEKVEEESAWFPRIINLDKNTGN